MCDERLDSWSRRLIEKAAIRLEVSGRENIKPGQSYLVMSNHVSHYDIPVLYQALCLPLRMVAKKELFRIPVMGRAMRAAGFVELDRQNRRRSIEALSNAPQRLHQGASIWIAPEGTRSRTGRLGTFKRGGFRMALENDWPILPVAIEGTGQVLPAGSLVVRKEQSVKVRVLSSFYPHEYRDTALDVLVAQVSMAIESQLSAPSISIATVPNSSGDEEWAR